MKLFHGKAHPHNTGCWVYTIQKDIVTGRCHGLSVGDVITQNGYSLLIEDLLETRDHSSKEDPYPEYLRNAYFKAKFSYFKGSIELSNKDENKMHRQGFIEVDESLIKYEDDK